MVGFFSTISYSQQEVLTIGPRIADILLRSSPGSTRSFVDLRNAEPGGFFFEVEMIETAVMVDGAFFLKRYSITYGKKHAPDVIAKNLFTYDVSQKGVDMRIGLDIASLAQKCKRRLKNVPVGGLKRAV